MAKYSREGFYKKMCKRHGVLPSGNAFIDKKGKLTAIGKKRFARAKFRKGVRLKVFNNARNAAGIVRDPNTGVRLKKKAFAMGHRPRHEHKKHQISAAVQEKNRKQFLNESNDPANYHPEDSHSNSSHAHEDSTNKYEGK